MIRRASRAASHEADALGHKLIDVDALGRVAERQLRRLLVGDVRSRHEQARVQRRIRRLFDVREDLIRLVHGLEQAAMARR